MALASSSSVLWGTASGIMPMLVAASLIISLMFLCFGASTRRGFRPDETEAPRSLRYFPGRNLGSPIPPKGGCAPCAHRAGVFEANSGECQPAFAMFLACLAPVLGVLAHFGPEFVGDFDNNLAVLGLIMVSPTLSYAIYRGVSNRIRSAERSPSPLRRPSRRGPKNVGSGTGQCAWLSLTGEARPRNGDFETLKPDQIAYTIAQNICLGHPKRRRS